MEKRCAKHGAFSVPVWRNRIGIDAWRGSDPERVDPDCDPRSCGSCTRHMQGSCCALLEVTRRCNLHCRFCFAQGEIAEPSLDELKRSVEDIYRLGNAPLLQLSGGEPTLRDDLPELIAFAKKTGYTYIQLNTNGIRLADDAAYVAKLAAAGLSFVFLQFDGTDDAVYQALRGTDLLERKTRAIDNCAQNNLGVTLVPTLVRGVNVDQIGSILRFAIARSPAVRGVHFQPVSFFGRYPGIPAADERYTLDELVEALVKQAGIEVGHILPSRCDHPLCGFHSSFIVLQDEKLVPMSLAGQQRERRIVTAKANREYIGRRWQRTVQAAEPDKRGRLAEKANDGVKSERTDACCRTPHNDCCCGNASSSIHAGTLDDFLHLARLRSFTITAMAFQDAMNLDLERLARCSLHVYDQGSLIPFCARYLTPITLPCGKQK